MGCEDVGDLLRLGHHAALTERLLVVSRTTTATHRHDRTVTSEAPSRRERAVRVVGLPGEAMRRRRGRGRPGAQYLYLPDQPGASAGGAVAARGIAVLWPDKNGSLHDPECGSGVSQAVRRSADGRSVSGLGLVSEKKGAAVSGCGLSPTRHRDSSKRPPPPSRRSGRSRGPSPAIKTIRFGQSQNAPILAIGFKPARSIPIDGVPSFLRVRLDVRVVG